MLNIIQHHLLGESNENEWMFTLIFQLKTICEYCMLKENSKMQHVKKHPRINTRHQAPKYEHEWSLWPAGTLWSPLSIFNPAWCCKVCRFCTVESMIESCMVPIRKSDHDLACLLCDLRTKTKWTFKASTVNTFTAIHPYWQFAC